MPRNHPPYPAEFKAEAVRLVGQGVPISQVAADLGVSAQSIRAWIKQAAERPGPTSPLAPRKASTGKRQKSK
jgi:transposase